MTKTSPDRNVALGTRRSVKLRGLRDSVVNPTPIGRPPRITAFCV